MLMNAIQDIAELDLRTLALDFVLDVILEHHCIRLLAGDEGKRMSSQGVPSGLFLDETV